MGVAVTLPHDVIPPADRIYILVELPKSIIGTQAGLLAQGLQLRKNERLSC